MVDTPKGRTEILIDGFFGYCKTCFKFGKKKTSPQRREVKRFKRRHPRIAKAALVAVLTLAIGLVVVGFATPKTVTVNIDDSISVVSTTYETTAMRVDSFVETHQIDYVYGQDIIDVEYYDRIIDDMVINIKKAASIPVTADGTTLSVITLPVTVEEFLEELEIKVGEDDIVEPSLDHVLKKGDHVVVKRVTFDTAVEEVDVDFETVYSSSYGMPIGDMAVTQEGTTGREKRTYKVTYIDGIEDTRELESSETLVPVQNKVISYGVSMNFSAPSGLRYKEKISDVRAVSYHFSGNPRGAYGKPCTYGTCAVDPNVIPLGSLIYVEGYGYAIANDVGASIKGNVIDVYMEYGKQCYIWGARNVDVYVIN